MEFTIGQIIYHETLGEGEITKITERKDSIISNLPIVEVRFKSSTHEKIKEGKFSYERIKYPTPYYEFTTQSLAEHLLSEDILS